VREILEETGLLVKDMILLPKNYSKVWEHEEYIQDTILHCYVCRVNG
jgi:8-oxo-dGTP pyrophosphatase MutT (NUDIX family)